MITEEDESGATVMLDIQADGEAYLSIGTEIGVESYHLTHERAKKIIIVLNEWINGPCCNGSKIS